MRDIRLYVGMVALVFPGGKPMLCPSGREVNALNGLFSTKCTVRERIPGEKGVTNGFHR